VRNWLILKEFAKMTLQKSAQPIDSKGAKMRTCACQWQRVRKFNKGKELGLEIC